MIIAQIWKCPTFVMIKVNTILSRTGWCGLNQNQLCKTYVIKCFILNNIASIVEPSTLFIYFCKTENIRHWTFTQTFFLDIAIWSNKPNINMNMKKQKQTIQTQAWT